MEALVASLMLWIGANSEYDTVGMPPPEIQIVAPQRLTDARYSASGLSPVDPHTVAAYDFEAGPNGRIYIIDPVLVEAGKAGEDPLENPLFQEVLLRELVDHVQRVSGAYDAFRCPMQGQVEAYRLGGTFLQKRRVEDPIPNRSFWAYFHSRC